MSSDQLLKGNGKKRCGATHMEFFTRMPQRNSICDYYPLEHRNFQATVRIAIKCRRCITGTYRIRSLGSKLCCGLVERFPCIPPCYPRIPHQRHAHSPVFARLLPDEVRTCAFYKTLGAHQNAGHTVSLAPRLRCLARQK